MTKSFIALLFFVLVLLIFAVRESNTQDTNIRLFCSNGRVFIEFQEKNNTWGTMWLNDDGLPVRCGKEMTNYKDMT